MFWRSSMSDRCVAWIFVCTVVYVSVCCVLCVCVVSCCLLVCKKKTLLQCSNGEGDSGPLEGSASSSEVSENRRHTTLNTRKKSGHAWSIHHGEPSTKAAPNAPIQKGSDSQQLQHARLHPVFPQEPHVSSTSLHHVAMRMDRKLPKHLWNHGSIESMQDPLGNTAVQSTAHGRWRLQQPAQRSSADKSQSQEFQKRQDHEFQVCRAKVLKMSDLVQRWPFGDLSIKYGLGPDT